MKRNFSGFFARDFVRSVRVAGALFVIALIAVVLEDHKNLGEYHWPTAFGYGFLYSFLFIQIGRYILWLIFLWGKARAAELSYRTTLASELDEARYREFDKMSRVWKKEIARLRRRKKDSM